MAVPLRPLRPLEQLELSLVAWPLPHPLLNDMSDIKKKVAPSSTRSEKKKESQIVNTFNYAFIKSLKHSKA